MLKKLFIIVLLFIAPYNCFSQSLSIDQTIQYLNKLSFENQYFNHSKCDYTGYYQFTIEKTGLLSVYSISTVTCNDEKDSQYVLKNKKWLLGQIYIDEIDIENIQTYNYSSNEKYVDIKCHYEDKCITSIDTKNETSKRNSISIQTSDRYNKNRLFNALVYLLGSASEYGYKRDDGKDPFVNPSNKNNKSESTTPLKSDINKIPASKKVMNSSKEFRVPLKISNGVFTLTANINGLAAIFILDSGAGETNISSKTESKLIANGLINQSNYLTNGLYRLADGSIIGCKRVRIPKITVGGKIIYNVIASIGGENSPNLLGQSFLNKTFKWSIDNSQKALLLY